MIKVTLEDIQLKFDELVSGKVPWGDIANYAVSLAEANDRDELIIEPYQQKQKVWEGISYLTGVDLAGDTLGTYLHSVEDFVEFRRELDI
jgi:hypothetical protein